MTNAKNTEVASATISAGELAKEMNINAKSLRRFMRSLSDDRAGRGGKYAIDRATADQIIAKYNEGPRRQTVQFTIKN